MISPAFWITTASPMRTSLRSSSSALCRLARRTVVPASSTGSSSATGVNLPVLPTCTVIPVSRVTACSASYLNAIVHRGLLLRAPSRSRWFRLSTLTTRPSVWKSSVFRWSLQRWACSITSSIESYRAVCGLTGMPHVFINRVRAKYDVSSIPDTRPARAR